MLFFYISERIDEYFESTSRYSSGCGLLYKVSVQNARRFVVDYTHNQKKTSSLLSLRMRKERQRLLYKLQKILKDLSSNCIKGQSKDKFHNSE
jgi:hypothetical protein